MKPVDLVDEQNVVRLETHEDSRKIAGFVKHGSGSGLEPYAEFIGYDVGKSGLAQPRRAMEQGVVERFAAHSGGLHEHAEIVHNLVLAGEIVEAERTQRPLYVVFHAVGTPSSSPYVNILCHIDCKYNHFLPNNSSFGDAKYK